MLNREISHRFFADKSATWATNLDTNDPFLPFHQPNFLRRHQPNEARNQERRCSSDRPTLRRTANIDTTLAEPLPSQASTLTSNNNFHPRLRPPKSPLVNFPNTKSTSKLFPSIPLHKHNIKQRKSIDIYSRFITLILRLTQQNGIVAFT